MLQITSLLTHGAPQRIYYKEFIVEIFPRSLYLRRVGRLCRSYNQGEYSKYYKLYAKNIGNIKKVKYEIEKPIFVSSKRNS